MRIQVAILIAALSGAVVPGQADASALEKKLEAKLSQDWVGKASWITDFTDAKARAKKGDGVVFAYFTRSYAP